MSNRMPRNPSIHQCKLCHRYHSLRFCRSFLAMGPTDRNRVVRRYRYCVNCLARTHMVSECDCPDTCMYCEQLHHTLLHQQRRTRTLSSRRSVHERLGERPVSENSQTTRSRNAISTRNNPTVNNPIRRRKRRNERRKKSDNNSSSATPNKRILYEAIRSLAEVLCASNSSNF